MVPVVVSGGNGEDRRNVDVGWSRLGVNEDDIARILKSLGKVKCVATHKEPDFDALFSSWALNILRKAPEAPIYTGNGKAAGIERRIPGLIRFLKIDLRPISDLHDSPYALLDASAGTNKNVGARREAAVCIDTHQGAPRAGSDVTYFSDKHAAVSSIVTALIDYRLGKGFWNSPLGKSVAAGLYLGVMTDSGMTPTQGGEGLYGTNFDKVAVSLLTPYMNGVIVGSYIASPFWERVNALACEVLSSSVSGSKSSDQVQGGLCLDLPTDESDVTGLVAEKILGQTGTLVSVYAAKLVGAGMKVSVRFNPSHLGFNPSMASQACSDMVVAGASRGCLGEASWRSGGRVLGGYWPVTSNEQAQSVANAIFAALQRIVVPGAGNVLQ